MTDLVPAATLLLQAGVLAVLVEGARRRNLSVVVNAVVALLATLVPAGVGFWLRRAHGWEGQFAPELGLWIGAATLVHAVGMVGLYDDVWWWDHLAHVLSAALVAALAYAGVIVAGEGTVVGGLPGGVASATVLVTLAAGVFWELLEVVARDVGEHFDVDPVLVIYGPGDTAFDLVFDVLGALLVVALDVRVFVPLAGAFPATTRSVLVTSVWAVVAGSVLLGLGVALGSGRASRG